MKKKKEETKIMETQIATRPEEETLPAELAGSWGSEDIDNEDIVLPKLLLMQAMSEMVSEKETAEAGDIVKSTTEKIVGDREHPLEFIPLSSNKTWIISQKAGSKFEYRTTEPITPQNAASPLEWKDENGAEWRRDKSLNFYVLLRKEIEGALRGEVASVPCLVSFRRTSYMAGRKLASGIAESRFLKRPAASRVYNLSVIKKTNDKGTFYLFDVTPSGQSTNEEISFARKWFDTLQKGAVKVHEAVDGEE